MKLATSERRYSPNAGQFLTSLATTFPGSPWSYGIGRATCDHPITPDMARSGPPWSPHWRQTRLIATSAWTWRPQRMEEAQTSGVFSCRRGIVAVPTRWGLGLVSEFLDCQGLFPLGLLRAST